MNRLEAAPIMPLDELMRRLAWIMAREDRITKAWKLEAETGVKEAEAYLREMRRTGSPVSR